MIFLKYRGKIYPFKLEITKHYITKFSDATDEWNSYKFLFDILFSSPTDRKRFMFVRNKVFLSWRYPFSILLKQLTLQGEVDIYLSDPLYNNDKWFLNNVPEKGAIDVDSNLLSFFRNQLQDSSYNVSKIYGFHQKRGFHSIDLKHDNLLTDFDLKIKMKKQSATNSIKKIFDSTLYLHKEKTEIEPPPTIKEILESQMDKLNINILKKQIDFFVITTDVICLSCEGLSNAKEALINSELKKVLGVTYLSKVPNWSLAKGQTKRSQAIFVDSEFQTKSSHLAFAFTTRNLSDLLIFTVTLLDSNGKEIKFPQDEKKILTIGYRIEIIKWQTM